MSLVVHAAGCGAHSLFWLKQSCAAPPGPADIARLRAQMYSYLAQHPEQEPILENLYRSNPAALAVFLGRRPVHGLVFG